MTAQVAARRAVELRRLRLRHLVVAAVVPVILLGLFGAAVLLRLPATSPTAIGAVAPDFSVVDLEGNPINLRDLRGRPVIVNFWASWCVACPDEFPLLRDAEAQHRDDGLAVVGIVYQDRTQAAADFVTRNGGSWPVAMDPDGRVADAYAIFGPPETFFIGRDGSIKARVLGQITEATIDEKVALIMER
jgi:cytochrome c biogenesis protein CcmG, thiol:disulfide interchange protein DsbE